MGVNGAEYGETAGGLCVATTGPHLTATLN
jgi:hypothetical protein